MRVFLAGFFLLHIFNCCARAEWVGIPESRHHQYLTYALFTEEQSGLLMRGSKRSWGALGASIAMVELPDWWGKPQLVLGGSVNASFRQKDSPIDFLTETFDARFGMWVEFEASPQLRFSVGLLHLSGHTADSLIDLDLVAPNLGEDRITLRVIYDALGYFRMGATLRPAINRDPAGASFGADQFVEFYPFKVAENPQNPTPFLAAGLEEYGRANLVATVHLQAGVYVGNHTRPNGRASARLVVGYYNGLDPRLKYAVFKNARADFGYFGLLFTM